MAKSKTSEVIRLGSPTAPVRLSFLRLDKPEAFQEGQEPKFQATALLDPSNAEHAALIKKIRAEGARLCTEAYGEVPEEIKLEPHNRLCFGDANKHPKKKKYDGYENMFYVALANTTRPAVANRAGNSLVDAEGRPMTSNPQWPYAGAYGIVTCTLWALMGPMRVKWGPRISGNLRGVQFVQDGEAFGSGTPSAEEEFEALEDNAPEVSSGADDDFGSSEDDPFAV